MVKLQVATQTKNNSVKSKPHTQELKHTTQTQYNWEYCVVSPNNLSNKFSITIMMTTVMAMTMVMVMMVMKEGGRKGGG